MNEIKLNEQPMDKLHELYGQLSIQEENLYANYVNVKKQKEQVRIAMVELEQPKEE